ncbi:MAG: hypothetical protein WC544_02550 [Patescibacteria group bacterium]
MIKKLLISVTGHTRHDWKNKLREISKYHLKEIALFLEAFPPKERTGLLPALEASEVQAIPLVHLRDDTSREEIKMLKKRFKTKFFTIHESHFSKKILSRWRGFHKYLCLEMNADNSVASSVHVDAIGGFCIDCAHFKIEVSKQDDEYRYIIEHLKKSPAICNHISGYSYARNKDVHTPHQIRNFNYLTTLPKSLFGRILAIEIYNSITDQLTYAQYIKKNLGQYLDCKII